MSVFHYGSISTNTICCLVAGAEAYLMHLEVPDGFREEACSDQVQEASRDDQEGLDRGEVASSVSDGLFAVRF